jgi:hypothetical protein
VTAMAPWWAVKPTSLAEDQPVEQPPDEEGDWLDKLWAYDDLAPATADTADTDADTDAEDADTDADTADTDAESTTAKGRWFVSQAGYWPSPSLPALPARPALSEGTKRLLYNVAAAGAGWYVGLGPTIGGWIESCGRETSIGGALVLGGGICLGIAVFWDRRTRHWQPAPLAWLARIPLASALTALALYAPASQI